MTKEEATQAALAVANKTKQPQVIHPLPIKGGTEWMHREVPSQMTDWQFRFAEIVKPIGMK